MIAPGKRKGEVLCLPVTSPYENEPWFYYSKIVVTMFFCGIITISITKTMVNPN